MSKTPKKQGFSIQGFDASHIQQTEQYTKAIDTLYNQAVAEYSQMASKLKIDPAKPFSFSDYPGTKAKAEVIASQLANKMQSVIVQGSEKQWLYACQKNDAFLSAILDTSKVKKSVLNKYQDRNLDALKTFQTRKVNGMGLSDRIWNYSGQMKKQMELGIDVAIGDGKSAQSLSRELKQYLVDPDKLFRQVRDKRGVLHLSKNAEAFHPGQGKYRSSHKNAMRLTRSEINMAYRESDQLRWQQLDFVVGFEVMLSNNHPVYDICDIVKGKYPKEFKFVGWHPQCRCKCIPILQDPKEFNTDELNELSSAINGTEYKPFQSANTVTDVPKGFKDWIADNTERSKGWKSQPYFIKDNFVGGRMSGGLKLATKSAESLAAEKLAAEAAKAAAEALAAEQAIAAAKAKVLADKKIAEIVYAKKKIVEAESLGISSKNLEALKLAIEDESLTYAQIAGKSSKLVKDIKAQKLIKADPLSREHLLTKFSQSEVDSLFGAYERKIADISRLGTAEKISKLEFEIDWIPSHSRYSTSDTMIALYKRDVELMKASYESERITDQAKTVIYRFKDYKETDVKAAVSELKASLATGTTDLKRIQKAIDEVGKVGEQYKIQRTAGMPPTLANQEETVRKWIQDKARGLSKSDINEIEGYMAELIDNGEFSMRFNGRDIEGIMQHGFLNQIELRELGLNVKSGGMLDPDRRITASNNLFGTDTKKAKAFDYEHYGYLGDKDMAVEIGNYGPSSYGRTIAYFKKDNVQATFTMNDSLGSGLAPSLTTNPKVSSVSNYSFNNIISASKSVGTKNIHKFTNKFGTSYIELQYHGKVDLTHVEKILISESDASRFTPEVIRKLKSFGIKLYLEKSSGIVKL
jgi:hypothetical protein